jgi:hypothetical protein
VTVGDDLNSIAQFLAPDRDSYSAVDVVHSILGETARRAAAEEMRARTEMVLLATA